MEARISVNGFRRIKVEPCATGGNCKPFECKAVSSICELPDLVRELRTNGCTDQNKACEPTSPINSRRCPETRCERSGVIFDLQKLAKA